MKQPKKPNLSHKKAMRRAGLDFNEWMVAHDTNKELTETITVIDKKTGERRVIDR